MPEGKEKGQEIGYLLEQIMKENFPKFVKEIDMQVQEAQRVPIKLDPKRTTPRHIIIKMPSVKDIERILKAARGKQKVTYKGVSIRQQIHNYQQLNLKNKNKNKLSKRTGAESQIWRSFGGLSVGRENGETRRKVQGLRSTNW